MRSVRNPARNANSIETRKSLIVIGPTIRKLDKNFIIPALERPQLLHKNFAGNTDGSSHPKGSKNLTIDRMAHLVRSGDDGTVTRN